MQFQAYNPITNKKIPFILPDTCITQRGPQSVASSKSACTCFAEYLYGQMQDRQKHALDRLAQGKQLSSKEIKEAGSQIYLGTVSGHGPFPECSQK
jgi:hypothetical protein